MVKKRVVGEGFRTAAMERDRKVAKGETTDDGEEGEEEEERSDKPYDEFLPPAAPRPQQRLFDPPSPERLSDDDIAMLPPPPRVKSTPRKASIVLESDEEDDLPDLRNKENLPAFASTFKAPRGYKSSPLKAQRAFPVAGPSILKKGVFLLVLCPGSY